MMDLKFSRVEKSVGLFMTMVVLLVLVTVVLIGRGQDWFRDYVTYYTTFKEGYNLQVGAPVKLFKTDIGKVKKITLVEDKVRVELAILEEYASRIRKDTLATVESPTIIGSEYVSIRPGPVTEPAIPERGVIKSMDRKSLDDIMQEFELEKTAKMLIGAIQNLSDMVEELQDPGGPLFSSLRSVEKTLKDVRAIVADVQAGEGTVGGLLKSDELLVKINDAMDQIDQILANVERGSEDVPAITKSTKRGLQETRDTVKEIDRLVKAAQKNALIRRDIPPALEGKNMDAGLRR
ncbi:MAG TPA: MlaD family protein [Syntrophales bacterium]|nr:MlaD family protein [Syntrophales bacterium]HOX94287.1 MlaD family protein [Syntrophales bacterium]HPI56221.1 MlaD family protein [Syntrophales bacterium]HPN24409.1 MlaD family protein [Syntrophales bacterium]